MRKKSITVQCEGGLHLHIAEQPADGAHTCGSDVHDRCCKCQWQEGCSIEEIRQLGEEVGTALEITVEGADDEETLADVSERPEPTS